MEINVKNIVNLSNVKMSINITNIITVTHESPAAVGSSPGRSDVSQAGTSDIIERRGESQGGGGSGAAQGRPTSAKRRETLDNDTGTSVVIIASQPQFSLSESEAEHHDQAGLESAELGNGYRAPREGDHGAGGDGVEGCEIEEIEEIVLEDADDGEVAEAEGRPPQPPLLEAAEELPVNLDVPAPDRQSRVRRHRSWSQSCTKRKCVRCIEKGL